MLCTRYIRYIRDRELDLLDTRVKRTIEAWCAKQLKLDAMKDKLPLSFALGEYMYYMDMSPEEWIASWDRDGDGKISKGEFKQRCLSLKVRCIRHIRCIRYIRYSSGSAAACSRCERCTPR